MGVIEYKDVHGVICYAYIGSEGVKPWRGVAGTHYVWHGEWADAEVINLDVDEGEIPQAVSEADLDDYIWVTFKAECEETGKTPTDEGFEAWLEKYETDVLKCALNDVLACVYESL